MDPTQDFRGKWAAARNLAPLSSALCLSEPSLVFPGTPRAQPNRSRRTGTIVYADVCHHVNSIQVRPGLDSILLRAASWSAVSAQTNHVFVAALRDDDDLCPKWLRSATNNSRMRGKVLVGEIATAVHGPQATSLLTRGKQSEIPAALVVDARPPSVRSGAKAPTHIHPDSTVYLHAGAHLRTRLVACYDLAEFTVVEGTVVLEAVLILGTSTGDGVGLSSSVLRSELVRATSTVSIPAGWAFRIGLYPDTTIAFARIDGVLECVGAIDALARTLPVQPSLDPPCRLARPSVPETLNGTTDQHPSTPKATHHRHHQKAAALAVSSFACHIAPWAIDLLLAASSRAEWCCVDRFPRPRRARATWASLFRVVAKIPAPCPCQIQTIARTAEAILGTPSFAGRKPDAKCWLRPPEDAPAVSRARFATLAHLRASPASLAGLRPFAKIRCACGLPPPQPSSAPSKPPPATDDAQGGLLSMVADAVAVLERVLPLPSDPIPTWGELAVYGPDVCVLRGVVAHALMVDGPAPPRTDLNLAILADHATRPACLRTLAAAIFANPCRAHAPEDCFVHRPARPSKAARHTYKLEPK